MSLNERALLRAIITMAILRYLGMTAGISGGIAMGLSLGQSIAFMQPPDSRLWIGLALAVVGILFYVECGERLRRLKSPHSIPETTERKTDV